MQPALYARYSTENQRETSIADQLSKGRERCDRERWPAPMEFSDAATSASTLLVSRPGGKALLDAIYCGQVTVLIIEALDRVFRNLVDQEQTVAHIEFLGVRIIGLQDGYDSLNENREMPRIVNGMVNQQYLRVIGQKTHRGLIGQIERGYHAGGLSYGYKSVADIQGEQILGHHLVIDQVQAGWVRWMYEHYADGWSVQRLAHELNRLGIASARGGTWAVSAIYGRADRGSGVLNNELYIGKYVWNRGKYIKHPVTRKRIRQDNPESEWMIKPAPDLRIVSEELWLRAHERMRAPTREGGRGRGARPTTLFGGLLRCSICDGAVVAVSGTLYGCAARKDRGPSVCTGTFAKRDSTDKRLLALIREQLLAPGAIAEMHVQFKAALRALRAGSAGARESADKRRKELEGEIARLVDAIASVGVSSALAGRLKAAEAEKERLAAQVPVTPTAAHERAIEDGLARYKRQVMDLQGALTDDVGKARVLLRELVGEITLTQDGEGVFAAIGKPTEAKMVGGGGLSMGLVAGTRFCIERYRVA